MWLRTGPTGQQFTWRCTIKYQKMHEIWLAEQHLTSTELSSMEFMWRLNEYLTNSSQLPHLHTWLQWATGRSRAWSVCSTLCSSENIQHHNSGHCAYKHEITVLWTHQWWPNDPWWHSVLFLQWDGVLFDTDKTYNRPQVQHHGYEALQMAAPSIFHL